MVSVIRLNCIVVFYCVVRKRLAACFCRKHLAMKVLKRVDNIRNHY